MEGIIKVAPERLIATAGEFSTKGSMVSTLTSNMTQLATGLTSIWEGEASSAYRNKFAALDDDIQKMIRMIQEHAQDLEEMARLYSEADQYGLEQAGGLPADVIS